MGAEVTPKQILSEEAQKHGVTLAQFLEPGTRRHLSHPRQDAMMRVFIECPRYSLPRMGVLFQRDHTTVLHGVREAAKRAGLDYEQVKIERAKRLGTNPPAYQTQAMFRSLMAGYAQALKEGRAA